MVEVEHQRKVEKKPVCTLTMTSHKITLLPNQLRVLGAQKLSSDVRSKESLNIITGTSIENARFWTISHLSEGGCHRLEYVFR